MDNARRAEVRSKLKSGLDWPVTTGEVIAVAEQVDEPVVAKAATRLPDDGHWVEIDALWADLEPAIDGVADV